MPQVDIPGEQLNLPRNIALIDTNVLVAMFDPTDSLHPEAEFALEVDDRFWWMVVTPVLVEAAGLLKHRQGDLAVISMLRWLVTPGKRVLVLSCIEGFRELEMTLAQAADLIARRNIDFVDAYLMRIATLLTTTCGLVPSTPILTSDGRDFFVGRGSGYRYSVLDVRDVPGDAIPIGE